MDKEILKKLKNHKLALINKKNIKNGRMNIKLNKLNKPSEFNNTSPLSKMTVFRIKIKIPPRVRR